MNAQMFEALLREYLLSHRPSPFVQYVGSKTDPKKTSYIVFRQPGTLNDLVISVKFLPDFDTNNPHFNPTRQQLKNARIGTHWENAMVSGMDWRQKMNQQTSLASLSPSNQSLIIASAFTNQFGLELVGHIEEQPMEDVQFRFLASTQLPSITSCSTEALQHMVILDTVQIYRWKPRDERTTPWNLVGFIGPDVGSKSTANVVEQTEDEKLSLFALSKITERNDEEKSPLPFSIPPFDPPKLSYATLSFLKTALPLPIRLPFCDRKGFSLYCKSPFCQRNIATPNPFGPFVPPHLFVKIHWAPGPLDGESPKQPKKRTKKLGTMTLSPSPRKSRSSPRKSQRKSRKPPLASPPKFRRRRGSSQSHASTNAVSPRAKSSPKQLVRRPRSSRNSLRGLTQTSVPMQQISSRRGIVQGRPIPTILSRHRYSSASARMAPINEDEVMNEGNDCTSLFIEEKGPRRYPKLRSRGRGNQKKRRSTRQQALRAGRNITFDRSPLKIADDSKAVAHNSNSSPHRQDISPKPSPTPSKGDIAINLLCPYRHPHGPRGFFISHETPHQRAMRHTIETSLSCNHLRGCFVVIHSPQVLLPGSTFNPNHRAWRLEKVS